jgi:hypothetical protein
MKQMRARENTVENREESMAHVNFTAAPASFLLCTNMVTTPATQPRARAPGLIMQTPQHIWIRLAQHWCSPRDVYNLVLVAKTPFFSGFFAGVEGKAQVATSFGETLSACARRSYVGTQEITTTTTTTRTTETITRTAVFATTLLHFALKRGLADVLENNSSNGKLKFAGSSEWIPFPPELGRLPLKVSDIFPTDGNTMDAENRPQVVVSGSAMVQAVLGTRWQGSDVDIFCTAAAASSVRTRLAATGLICAGHCNQYRTQGRISDLHCNRSDNFNPISTVEGYAPHPARLNRRGLTTEEIATLQEGIKVQVVAGLRNDWKIHTKRHFSFRECFVENVLWDIVVVKTVCHVYITTFMTRIIISKPCYDTTLRKRCWTSKQAAVSTNVTQCRTSTLPSKTRCLSSSSWGQKRCTMRLIFYQRSILPSAKQASTVGPSTYPPHTTHST